MGDGDATDAADLGGPDFAPAMPPVRSSAVGAPPSSPAAIVLGPGYSGHVVLPRTSQLSPTASSGPAAGRERIHGGAPRPSAPGPEAD